MKRQLKTLVILCMAMVLCVSCKKDNDPEQPNSEPTVEIVPANVNIGEEINTDNLLLETFYEGVSLSGNSATIDLTNIDLPQIVAVTDSDANVYMLYRGRVNGNAPVVIDATSTVLALVTMHPMLGPITEPSEYNQLVGMIQSNSHYGELLQGVTEAIAAGTPVNDTTNLAVMTPLYNLYEELCDTTGMNTREDITDYCESYPIKVTAEGKKAILRATGLCPSYYGKVYMDDGSTMDLVVRSRADYGGMDMFTHTVDDMHLGEPTVVTFLESNGYVEFRLSRTNAQALFDLCLHLANQVAGMLGMSLDNAALNIIADAVASGISNAQHGNSVITPSLIAGCAYDGLLAYLRSDANNGCMANWQFAGGLLSKLSFVYNLVKNSCNAMWRIIYFMDSPEDINFCLEYRTDTGVIPCSENELRITGGDGQTGEDGETLPQPLEVFVTTKTYSGWYIHPELTVRFAVEEGGGSLRQTDVTVGSDQKARTWWTLGDGEAQRVSAVVVDPGTGEELSNKVCFTASADFVDLGLPSGLLWATRNVGANRPEEYGNYYAWGETTTKSDYDWTTYRWCRGSYHNLTKYNTDSDYGIVDNKTVLELADDAAHVNWGGDCRMPTEEEWGELRYRCTWTRTTQGGKSGYRVTGTNGNSIFLPAAGYRLGSSLNLAGSLGGYWSSSLLSRGPYIAICINFYLGDESVNLSGSRLLGCTVRPVCPAL
ncbi:MAG: hypothetical protein MJ000_02315 [Bacteroidales bacterium]|nr:hypothetical protein [Bacteroidales bacterium]